MQTLSALLVSNDNAAVRVTNGVLTDYSFNVQTAATPRSASELMKSSRFDLVIYDQQTPGAIDLASISNGPIPGIAFAILDGSQSADISEKRIHFSLQRPFTADLFARTVRAAYGMVIQEKRAAFRHEVQICASGADVLHAGQKRSLANPVIVNLSQTGLCLHVQGAVPQGATLQINFALPEIQESLHLVGIVVWTHASGRAGVRFTRIAVEERRKLHEWLDSRLPPNLGSMARTGLRRYSPELALPN